jgi:hypothetical protein
MATAATKQPPLVVELETKTPESSTLPALPAPVEAPASVGMDQMIERLAANKDVDVSKLEKIIELRERVMAHDAKAAFDAAYSRMQPEIPAIDEKGQIKVKETVRSKYARLEDIQANVKPILAKYGFALRHRTEWPEDRKGVIRIVGILSHEAGHSETSIFEAPLDRSEFRTDIQSMGSTVSYGRRYTTIDLLNIETRGVDDDGRKAGRPQPPDGYDEWAMALSQEAQKGLPAVEKMFAAAPANYRAFITTHDKDDFVKLRARARTGKPVAS